MKSKWKRNAVVGTMVVLVVAAVALNWKYAGTFDTFDAERVDANTKLLGEATLVSGQDAQAVPLSDGADASGANAEASADGADAGLVAGNAYSGADYFASARLTRQQARDNAVSLLQEAAKQPDATEAALAEASEGIQVLANYTMKEAQIENLVTAKGYQDCVAFMGDGSVSVVVSTGDEALQAEDVARIADIAMSETGFPASGVKIMSAN
ncbi:MAG: SpoIIIAH-like family protein [Oscillibacter sp.]|nr:SpoIIIAH-like family protein [Oscillibacter sp.]